MHEVTPSKSPKSIVWGIASVVVIYLAIVGFFPQLIGLTAHDSQEADANVPATLAETEEHHQGHQSGAATDIAHKPSMPHPLAVTPFLLLLGAIAVFPLLNATERWWESNLHRFYLAIGLAALTLGYYAFILPDGGFAKIVHVLNHAILHEYIPFIVLLFSLYTISGGIRIDADLIASPRVNATFLTVGGLLASFIGTTGAAMLLIRPLLDTNSERKHVQHTVVFFIIVVCNCGGCLLPIGDPPLFLGYLKGVAFLWTMENLWLPWLVTNSLIILLYLMLDHFVFFRRETKRDIRRDQVLTRRLVMSGLNPNVWLLVGVVLCVALLDPGKAVPGTNWHAWPYLREVLQLALVSISLLLGSDKIRMNNRFNYHAIVEVAALFIGIFICMQPAIEILHVRGGSLGLDTPLELFWSTGSLSAVLDNAPTYVVFFETAAADERFAGHAFHDLVTTKTELSETAIHMLQAISLGAVFMGAMTYIGNGPNFMVRAIAEQSGVRMPSFFGYIVWYTVPLLLPVFALVTWLFFI